MFFLFKRFFSNKKYGILPSDYIKQGWNKNHSAIDEHGRSVGSNSPDAVSWCLLGAMTKAFPNYNNAYNTYKDAMNLKLFFREGWYMDIITWNDKQDSKNAVIAICLEVETELGLR